MEPVTEEYGAEIEDDEGVEGGGSDFSDMPEDFEATPE